MNNEFDELTKSLAQAVTRRAALKKFGVGLAGMALASLGLANKAEAAGRWKQGYCLVAYGGVTGDCIRYDKKLRGCFAEPNPRDCPNGQGQASGLLCDWTVDTSRPCYFP